MALMPMQWSDACSSLRTRQAYVCVQLLNLLAMLNESIFPLIADQAW